MENPILNNWKCLNKIAATGLGIEDYLRNDILENITKQGYVINLGREDGNSGAILKMVYDNACSNLKNPLSKIYEILLNDTENLEENLAKANNLINLPLFKNEVVKIIKQRNAQTLLLVIQNVNENIMNEVSRLKNPYKVYKKLNSSYGNASADMENWIRELKSLKAKNPSQVIPVLDKVKEIYQEMENAKKQMTEKEKLKYMYKTLPRNFRKELNITFDTKTDTKIDTLYNTVK